MRLFNEKMDKTYATAENADKAVAKANLNHLRYIMAVDAEGRFFPVFLGEQAVLYGVHFKGFAVAN